MADANSVITILRNRIADLTVQLAIAQVEINELQAQLPKPPLHAVDEPEDEDYA